MAGDGRRKRGGRVECWNGSLYYSEDDGNAKQQITHRIQPPEGPPVYANWVQANSGSQALYTEEFPLFTDAHITGEAAYGPYEFLNTVPELEAGRPKPAVILRCSGYVDWPSPDMRRTSA